MSLLCIYSLSFILIIDACWLLQPPYFITPDCPPFFSSLSLLSFVLSVAFSFVFILFPSALVWKLLLCWVVIPGSVMYKLPQKHSPCWYITHWVCVEWASPWSPGEPRPLSAVSTHHFPYQTHYSLNHDRSQRLALLVFRLSMNEFPSSTRPRGVWLSEALAFSSNYSSLKLISIITSLYPFSTPVSSLLLTSA